MAATTHYAELKVYAMTTPGVENASCEFDVETLAPTYRLLVGIPGKSNAFAISQRLGLPEEIIQAAAARVSAENVRFEDVLTKLDQQRQEMEKEQRQAAQLRREMEQAAAKAQEYRDALAKEKEKAEAAGQGGGPGHPGGGPAHRRRGLPRAQRHAQEGQEGAGLAGGERPAGRPAPPPQRGRGQTGGPPPGPAAPHAPPGQEGGHGDHSENRHPEPPSCR